MNGLNAYHLDNQREKISENCAMIMHIGKEIHKVVKEKGVKVGWLATQIHTSRRNMQDIFKREDIGVITLTKISKVLNYNFFHVVEQEATLLVNEPVENYSIENQLLKEQLELSQKMIESKDKLLNEYKTKSK